MLLAQSIVSLEVLLDLRKFFVDYQRIGTPGGGRRLLLEVLFGWPLIGQVVQCYFGIGLCEVFEVDGGAEGVGEGVGEAVSLDVVLVPCDKNIIVPNHGSYIV